MIWSELNQASLFSPMAYINQNFLADEKTLVKKLEQQLKLSEAELAEIQLATEATIAIARQAKLKKGGVDAFMKQYDLSTIEGIVLMCLAEALLRIPDKHTADKLIEDKVLQGNWSAHLGQSDSLFVNASTWSLILTGKILKPAELTSSKLQQTLKRFLKSSSESSIRNTIGYAMKIIGKQFVMGEDIQQALQRARKREALGYRYSYDMLGEAAMTDFDAKQYTKAYAEAITELKAHCNRSLHDNPGISVKLSALHPRYELAQLDKVLTILYPRLRDLASQAKEANINFTIDAEESYRLEISLLLIEKLCQEPDLQGWNGLGLAVQAYQKRAPAVINWLAEASTRYNRQFMVRLVKGAYWDSEIKLAQSLGLPGYPVYTRKPYTDLAYLVCAEQLLANAKAFYPQFATHNAHTLATILTLSKRYHGEFEFQCLHGMGDALYHHIVSNKLIPQTCRIYAPVGTYKHLLAYLVRRLLENGANSSFVNRLTDENLPIAELAIHPQNKVKMLQAKPHPDIPLPLHLYGDTRLNAKTIDIRNSQELIRLSQQLQSQPHTSWHAQPQGALFNGKVGGSIRQIINPAQKTQALGQVTDTDPLQVDAIFATANKGFQAWHQTPVAHRAAILRKIAEDLETHFEVFIQIAILEAGKTLANAIAEVREAIDFCRYYAEQAEKLFSLPLNLPGPTGERNQLELQGRGVFVCISPWNFPLAIFLGQITAALVAGNVVIAKPAEQTSYIAYRAIELCHNAGVPKDVLFCLPGTGENIGAALIQHADVAGVMFTGSTQVAKLIQRTLAEKPGPIVPFIAETGGQNCMIVDSSALPEQVVRDVVTSAFDSAGQRCSALRVLYVQEDIADTVIDMLKGAMAELTVGNPQWLNTDIGPVIDAEAQQGLMTHIAQYAKEQIFQTPITEETKQQGFFVAPTAIKLESISQLSKEQFGPILHIITFKAKDLAKVIEAINSTGYGLTFGIHSRIESTIKEVTSQIKAGNIYVNRNTVGAIVGSQPFGGEGLSGTGPKAGGPHYLLRLVTERTTSTDTTASGGNTSLMTIGE